MFLLTEKFDLRWQRVKEFSASKPFGFYLWSKNASKSPRVYTVNAVLDPAFE